MCQEHGTGGRGLANLPRGLAAAKAGSGLFSVYDSGLKLAIQQTLSFTVQYNLSPLFVLYYSTITVQKKKC
jgi:hypothetical protein